MTFVLTERWKASVLSGIVWHIDLGCESCGLFMSTDICSDTFSHIRTAPHRTLLAKTNKEVKVISRLFPKETLADLWLISYKEMFYVLPPISQSLTQGKARPIQRRLGKIGRWKNAKPSKCVGCSTSISRKLGVGCKSSPNLANVQQNHFLSIWNPLINKHGLKHQTPYLPQNHCPANKFQTGKNEHQPLHIYIYICSKITPLKVTWK